MLKHVQHDGHGLGPASDPGELLLARQRRRGPVALGAEQPLRGLGRRERGGLGETGLAEQWNAGHQSILVCWPVARQAIIGMEVAAAISIVLTKAAAAQVVKVLKKSEFMVVTPLFRAPQRSQ